MKSRFFGWMLLSQIGIKKGNNIYIICLFSGWGPPKCIRQIHWQPVGRPNAPISVDPIPATAIFKPTRINLEPSNVNFCWEVVPCLQPKDRSNLQPNFRGSFSSQFSLRNDDSLSILKMATFQQIPEKSSDVSKGFGHTGHLFAGLLERCTTSFFDHFGQTKHPSKMQRWWRVGDAVRWDGLQPPFRPSFDGNPMDVDVMKNSTGSSVFQALLVSKIQLTST